MIKRINYLVAGTNEVVEKVTEYAKQLPLSTTFRVCQEVETVVELLKQDLFDILFLDASLEGFAHFSLPPNTHFHFEVVVISPNEQYALKAYEIGAIDFLLHPFSQEQFSKAFYKATRVKVTKQSISLPEKLIIKSGRRMEIVPFDTIMYIEAYGMYSKIIQQDGKVVVVNAILAWVEKQLPTQTFMRIHRSYIVNAKKITGFDKRKIYLNDRGFEVGATYKSMFEPLFNILDTE
ncbi:MAG: LytTR family DNA-binding domain-containing protein [Spirosomataceae bacterium]